MSGKTKQQWLAHTRIVEGLRWIKVHQKQFMARGSKAFLQGIKGEA